MSKGSEKPNEELAANVSRFEMLVAQHSDYLRRIELLLDEIETGVSGVDAPSLPTS